MGVLKAFCEGACCESGGGRRKGSSGQATHPEQKRYGTRDGSHSNQTQGLPVQAPAQVVDGFHHLSLRELSVDLLHSSQQGERERKSELSD